MSPVIWVLKCIFKISHSCKYWEKTLTRLLSVMASHNDILTFSHSHTSIWEKRYLWQWFASTCWEPALGAVSLLRPLAIIIHCDYKEKDDNVFQGSCLSLRATHRVSPMLKVSVMSSAPLCFLVRGKVRCTKKAERSREQKQERCHICLVVCSQIQGGKCLGDTFQKIKAALWLG